MKRFFENFWYGGAIIFVVLVTSGLIAMSLGGNVRSAGKHIPITFSVIIQSALVGSVFLGFFGAILDFISTIFVVKKSDTNDH